MDSNSKIIEAFKEYLQEIETVRVENVNNKEKYMKFSVQVPFAENRTFTCVMYCMDSIVDRIYFNLYGIGRVDEVSLKFLEALNEFNDTYDEKVYIDENKNLVLSSFSTTQMVEEEQNEWMIGVIAVAITRATIACEDMSEYILWGEKDGY